MGGCVSTCGDGVWSLEYCGGTNTADCAGHGCADYGALSVPLHCGGMPVCPCGYTLATAASVAAGRCPVQEPACCVPAGPSIGNSCPLDASLECDGGGTDASTDSGIDGDASVDGSSTGDMLVGPSDSAPGDTAWGPDADAGAALPDGGEGLSQ